MIRIAELKLPLAQVPVDTRRAADAPAETDADRAAPAHPVQALTRLAAQALGTRVNAAQRSAWAQSLGKPAGQAPAEALLRLEIAAEVPTPAEQLSERRLLQLQLLTRRHAAAPADTWAQDVADLLGSAHDERAARRLQNALKVLLKR